MEKIKEAGGTADFVLADVTTGKSAEKMVNFVADTYGQLDIAVNSAARIKDNRPIAEMDIVEFDDIIETNLKGVALSMKYELRQMMIQGKGGKIINISAVGQIGYRGQANYGSAKAGVVALTRTIAAEYTWCGVTANCILPGPIKTPLAMNSLQGCWEETVSKLMPQGKVGNPKDIAYMVKVFAAEEADYITAQIIAVDGGFDLSRY